MKCINKLKTISYILWGVLGCFLLTACGKKEYQAQYGMFDSNSSYSIGESSTSAHNAKLFASDICATDVDITSTSTINKDYVYAAAVYNLESKETLYSYNAEERVNPASLTKIMTAIIVLENTSLDDVVTIGDVTIKEGGAQLFKLKEGDKITVRDLLCVSTIYSGNDASLALANYVAGSEAAFAELMNEKAKELGATHTNFVNCNGLTDENHYTSAHDLYLMFAEAMKYPEFVTIMNTASMEINYSSAEGEYISKTITTTDKYLTGEFAAPNSIVVLGGKTGSTNAARKCLMIYGTDASQTPYIAVIMGAEDEPTLYHMMTNLVDDVCSK